MQSFLHCVTRWLAIASLVGATASVEAKVDAQPQTTHSVASANGVPIVYEVHGIGEPTLILIHGWSCDRSYWSSQLGPLAEWYKVVAVDLGGHGESGAGRRAWTIDSFGEDVAAVVAQAVEGDVILVGHSMGGDVAVAAALRLGDRVKAIIWVDTYRQFGARRSPEDIEILVRPFRDDFAATTREFVRGMFPAGADQALIERVAEDMASAPPEIAVPALESSLNYGRTITETIRGLEAPIVAINAEASRPDAESLKAHGVDVVPTTGVGHFMMMENPQSFNTLLLRILERYRSRDGGDR
ncbi:alpha/beta fold hydrolase [Sphingosinicella sp. CPCC 101087]|uniref:alpha/beta fold hydrolase n=1 Tax=Sphingosinicella sp. CPCC 101087 TaxID=2497754 RepID=UPI0013EB0C01|nr:alpha/beta hydrolase [Sphingosinicella sp. CPCC 101087]